MMLNKLITRKTNSDLGINLAVSDAKNALPTISHRYGWQDISGLTWMFLDDSACLIERRWNYE